MRVAALLRIPATHQWPEIAEDGGLMGYGPRFTQTFRQRARIVSKILRGTKPADIPVEQPTRFELVINLLTAKAIGHEIPDIVSTMAYEAGGAAGTSLAIDPAIRKT